MESIEYIDTVVKTSEEGRPYTINYEGRLPEGATLVSCTVSAVKKFGGATDNTVLASTTATVDGDDASFEMRDGVDEQRYVIKIKAIHSASAKPLVDFLLLLVKDSPRG